MPTPKGSSKKISAGLLMCRRGPAGWQFLVAHPGGPFFARKDEGAWSIPKGLIDPGEDPLVAARREFEEETGFSAQSERYLPLGQVAQAGGKVVHAWAFEGDCDPSQLRSNTFSLIWPPRSGTLREVPEIDRVAFCDAAQARFKLNPAQAAFIERAIAVLPPS
jgi:predicted NUDIX family NTP pyrophosphohydrolase